MDGIATARLGVALWSGCDADQPSANLPSNPGSYQRGTVERRNNRRGSIFRLVARFIFVLASVVSVPSIAEACVNPVSVCTEEKPGSLALIKGANPVPILTDNKEESGVLRAVKDLQADFARVSGKSATLLTATPKQADAVIIVGTIGRSKVIDRLIAERKLDVTGVTGQWEAYVHQVVDKPLPGIARALVIAGADRRGTIFGTYDLSERIGVSPWYWWADVPVARKAELHVLPGRRFEKPAVRYRGIFINDENPALYGWVNHTFGGFNHKFYAKVYELILRMRGNFLWPAMWGKALYDDDPLNAPLAHEYGVVIGTSHHEPMSRAHVEWERYGKGPWDYTRNAEELRRFWRHGIKRMGKNESLVTIGMRGDGDEPMTEGTAISLLETIVADQREIISEATGKPAAETPQVWALYKEVQDYYDKGMTVPDDVTLLFADDNWGNIRRLPKPGAKRPGGYGVYYHFDYVGGPRNYKWINTTQIERVWEQMNIAYEHGVDRLWIVNVGDIKPMEFPTHFFLDFAWNPEAWPLQRLPGYSRDWAARQFGEEHAAQIGELLTRYGKYSARRKPELTGPETYSLIHFREAERVLTEWQSLLADAQALRDRLPKSYHDAYFQLVLHPIMAFENLNRLYITVAKNRLHAAQGRADTNALAEQAKTLFAKDREIRRLYEEAMAGGKWVHMMSQTHIGYTSWQQPDKDVMPEVLTIAVPEKAGMGVAIEGSDQAWSGVTRSEALPIFDPFNNQKRIIEVFNRGRASLSFKVRANVPWLQLSQTSGSIVESLSLGVSIDWAKAPVGDGKAEIALYGSDGSVVTVPVRIFNPANHDDVRGFVETEGHVTIEAEHYARAVSNDNLSWVTIPDLSRTKSGVTVIPSTAPAQTADATGAWLEYLVHLFSTGTVELRVMLSPTLDFKGQGGLRYAVAIDNEVPQIVNVHADGSEKAWERSVADNVRVLTTRHTVTKPGSHVVRVWAIDPGLVFQRLTLVTGKLGDTYLGPPESPRR